MFSGSVNMVTPSPTVISTPVPTVTSTPLPTQTPVINYVNTGDYIFPDSSSSYLIRSQVVALSGYDMYLARNEFMHGMDGFLEIEFGYHY